MQLPISGTLQEADGEGLRNVEQGRNFPLHQEAVRVGVTQIHQKDFLQSLPDAP